MNKIKVLPMLIVLSIFLAPIMIQAQKAKKAEKAEKQKVLIPQQQTICEGTPLPKGYYISEQIMATECIKKNQTGRAFILKTDNPPREEKPVSSIQKRPTLSSKSQSLPICAENTGLGPDEPCRIVTDRDELCNQVQKTGGTKVENDICQVEQPPLISSLSKIRSGDKVRTTIGSKSGTVPPNVVSGGILNGKATRLVQPSYPSAAKAVHASGTVNVQVLIDESGNVVSASPMSGNPLLRAAAMKAARSSKFTPTELSGQPVKVSGIIVYNFTAQ